MTPDGHEQRDWLPTPAQYGRRSTSSKEAPEGVLVALELSIRQYIKKPREKIESHGALLYSDRMEFATLPPSYRINYFGIKGSLEPIATSPAPCKTFSTCRARAAIVFEVAFATAL